MLILDCHNVNQTYSSLASILDLRRGKIDKFLSNCDPESVLGPDPFDWPDDLFGHLKEQMSIEPKYSATYWFHLTRLPAGTDFSEGLRPLHETLHDILEFLGDMVADRVGNGSLKSFKKSVLNGEIESGTLQLRSESSQQQGPFGWLVRDFAFHQSPKRDYFRSLPEAVEDLIGTIEGYFGIDLESKYREHSNSFIVKFQTSDSSETHLSAALYYLWALQQGDGLSDQCAIHCSMHGQRVPASDIIEVEEFSDPPPLKPLSSGT